MFEPAPSPSSTSWSWFQWLVLLLVVGGWLAICGGIPYYHYVVYQEWQLQEQLLQTGVETDGVILTLEEVSSSRGASHCDVTFEYKPFGLGKLQTADRVTQDFCQIFSPGSTVTVRYLPRNPTQARVQWGGYTELQIFILVVVDVMLGGTFLYGVWQWRKESQLQKKDPHTFW
jgi:hypothetical protein